VLDPRNVAALRRRLRREPIALVHAHLPLVGAVARLAARGLPTRVVYTEHNTPAGYHPASRWLNAATWRLQDAVIAVSDPVRRGAPAPPRRARGRSAVIPNGVDLGRLEREARAADAADVPEEPPGAFVALVPATLARRKGQDVLLRALARLPERAGRPLRVWLAGDGPDEAALRRLAERLGVGPRLRWLGRRDDVFALMARARAVVLPSRTEGHPLALLEALALGRPVLAAAVGGVPEVVADGRTGLLVAPEDPSALARALGRLRDDAALGPRLGAAAARDARARFDVRRTVREVEAVYRRCLALAPGPPPLPSARPQPEETPTCAARSAPSRPSPSRSSPPPAW
jgi:glycosyltransferase involved in cell wall biosynthesis